MWKRLFTLFTTPVLGVRRLRRRQIYFFKFFEKKACLYTEVSFSQDSAGFYEGTVISCSNTIISFGFFIFFLSIFLARRNCDASVSQQMVSYAQSYPQADQVTKRLLLLLQRCEQTPRQCWGLDQFSTT